MPLPENMNTTCRQACSMRFHPVFIWRYFCYLLCLDNCLLLSLSEKLNSPLKGSCLLKSIPSMLHMTPKVILVKTLYNLNISKLYLIGILNILKIHQCFCHSCHSSGCGDTPFIYLFLFNLVSSVMLQQYISLSRTLPYI